MGFSSMFNYLILLYFYLKLSLEIFFSLVFFSSYQKLMSESSRMPLFDLRKLNASLPVPSVQDSVLKILVLGANDDFIVVKLGSTSITF